MFVAAICAFVVSAPTASAKKPLPTIVLVAAPDNPDDVAKIKNTFWRNEYQRELAKLDTFLAFHPVMWSLRERLWYIGHHNRSVGSPHQVAGAVWCAVYDPRPCRVVHGVLQ